MNTNENNIQLETINNYINLYNNLNNIDLKYSKFYVTPCIARTYLIKYGINIRLMISAKVHIEFLLLLKISGLNVSN